MTTYLDRIKGKPYCLKLGNIKPESDNFKGFFETFYTYLFRTQLSKPLTKPSPSGYDPISPAKTSSRPRSKPKLSLRRQCKQFRTAKETQTLEPPQSFRTLSNGCREPNYNKGSTRESSTAEKSRRLSERKILLADIS
jgi:hypothetical protein